MKAPQYQAPPIDPEITQLRQESQADDIRAGQQKAEIDTASLMARYGTRLALAGATTSPLTAQTLATGPGNLARPLVRF